MTRSSSTMTCLRCGNKDLAISQYECPQCGKPNLKAITTGTMIGGSWVALCFIGLFGLIAAATVWHKIEALLK